MPPSAKTPDVLDAEAFFEDLVRHVDSSLLDEWEKLRDPGYVAPGERVLTERPAQPFSRNRPAFIRAVRNAVFAAVKALAHGNHEALMETIEAQDSGGVPWTRERVQDLTSSYFENHARIRLDPEARSHKHTRIAENPDAKTRRWTCEQTLVDPDEHNDWVLVFTVDADACDARSKPVLVLESLLPLISHP